MTYTLSSCSVEQNTGGSVFLCPSLWFLPHDWWLLVTGQIPERTFTGWQCGQGGLFAGSLNVLGTMWSFLYSWHATNKSLLYCDWIMTQLNTRAVEKSRTQIKASSRDHPFGKLVFGYFYHISSCPHAYWTKICGSCTSSLCVLKKELF